MLLIVSYMQYIFDIYLVIDYNILNGGDPLRNKRLKMARVEKDLSQEELANMVGVTRQTIGLIEAGKYNPSLNLCLEICWATGKTLNDLFWKEADDDEWI